MRIKQTKQNDASKMVTVKMEEAAETETARLTGKNIRLTMEIGRLNAENDRLAQENDRVRQAANELESAKSLLATVKDELSSVQVQSERTAGELRTARHELGVVRAEVARLVGENQELDMRGIRADEEFTEVRGELVRLRGELQVAKAGSVELQSANIRMAEELEAALRLNVEMKDRLSEMEMDEIRADEEMTVLRAELVTSVSQSEAMKKLEQSLNQKDNLISDLENRLTSADLREEIIRDQNAQLQSDLKATRQDSEPMKDKTKILLTQSHVLAKELVAMRTQLDSAKNSLDMAREEIARLEGHIGRLVDEAAAKDEEIDATMSEREVLRVECNRLSRSNAELEHQKTTLEDDLSAEKRKTQASYRSSMSKLALMGEKSRQLETVSVELRSAIEEKLKLQKKNSQLRRALQASARAQGMLFVEEQET